MAGAGWVRKLCSTLLGFDPTDPPEKRRYDRAHLRFIEKKIAAGATYDDISTELRLRQALIEVKRRVSEWIAIDPYTAWSAIEVVTADVARKLSPKHAKILIDTVAQLGVADLATPAMAKRAHVAQMADVEMAAKLMRPSADQIAALRVSR